MQYLIPDHSRGSMVSPMGRLNLGRVESYGVITDPKTGQVLNDKFGNPIPNGLMNITLLESDSFKRDVPYVLPTVGNTMHFGGPPEIGSMCVVGWRQQNQPIILGFLPPSIDKLVALRQTIPNLTEGEIFLQSSKRTVDDDNNQNFFRGAYLWLDRYGRVQIDLQDYNMIIGYMLADEQTADVGFIFDPITNQQIFLRERLPGGVERRVDDGGNGTWVYGQTCYTRTGADFDLVATDNNNQTANVTNILDTQENGLQITDGVVELNAPAGSLARYTQGSEVVNLGGNQSTSIVGEMTLTVGEDVTRITGGDEHWHVTGSVDINITNDSTETCLLGKKKITASLGITLETPPAIPLKLGGESANSPAVCGDILLSFVSALFPYLASNFIPSNPPGLASATSALLTTFVTNPLTNLISLKVFVDKGLG